MTWLRRSIFVCAALTLSFSVGCGDNDGPDPIDMPDADPGGGDPPDAAPGTPDAMPPQFANNAAHWVSDKVIAIPSGMAGDSFELHHAAAGGITFDFDNSTVSGSDSVALTEDSAGLDAAVAAKFPHLSSYRAFALPADADTDTLVKNQLAVVAKDAAGNLLGATGVQIPGVLDDLYTYDGKLGPIFEGAADRTPELRVWAPTARSVALQLYDPDNDNAALGDAVSMTRDDATGVWSVTAPDESWYLKHYRYEVEVFAPRAAAGDSTTVPGMVVTNSVTDPYSVGLAMNSEYSLVVNLEDATTKPPGWDGLVLPENFDEPEDIVLYEGHVRDFSVIDSSITDPEHRGRYLAFTYDGQADNDNRPLSDGMAHLQRLAKPLDSDDTIQGVTHLHLLPVFDIATIEEDPSARIDIDDENSFLTLCGLHNDDLPVGNCAVDTTKTIREVLQGTLDLLADNPGDTEAIQETVELLRDLDGYNWGYDPFHYNVPEGSYATDANGTARIVEFREMVMGLAALDLRLVMDVVYNHTNASGQADKSVLDRVVPGYYHRLNAETGEVERSTCCENTATEHAMMEKLMIDSVVLWAEQYKVAGFRFDLMGHHMKSNMEKVRDTLAAIDDKIYIYGEGWDFGEVVSGARGENATQPNLAGTGIGTFSDRLRDAVRGGGPFDNGESLRTNQGFVNGIFYDANDANDAEASAQLDTLRNQADLIRVGMAGNLKDFVLINGADQPVAGSSVDYNSYEAGYCEDPQELITYIAAHDNQTLFDNNQYKIPAGTSMDDRVRIQNLGLSINILGQGIPFLHMGTDILRSKSMTRDSYDYGDWYNKVDFSYPTDPLASNNWNVGLPTKEKDGDAYDVIRDIIGDDSIAPTTDHMERTHAHVRELLTIRSSSVLFRLRTGDQVKTRVDFHNVGADQIPGLLVMTVTDGSCAGADLDPALENVAVLINASDEEQTFSAAGTPLADLNWILHNVLQNSDDLQVRNGTTFLGNEFTIPARTTGVFLQLQQDPITEGICNTKVAEEVQPPGGDVQATVYVRGELTDPAWDSLDLAFAKADEALYEVVVTGVAAGSYQFKVADANYSVHNWGGAGNATIAPGGSLTLDGGDNVTLNIATAGDYKFSLDTSNLNTPTLTVTAQ
ncbi:MAG: pullulanase-type alpha-1,6-glucosidase [Haliangiales bacterium]